MAFNFNAFREVTFPVTLNVSDGEDGKKEIDLYVMSPTLAQFKNYQKRRESEGNSLDKLSALCSEILSINTDDRRISPEDLEDMPIPALVGFLNEFFDWIAKTRNAKN